MKTTPILAILFGLGLSLQAAEGQPPRPQPPAGPPMFEDLNPEQRQARFDTMMRRLELGIEAIEKKAAGSPLTDADEQQLKRLRDMKAMIQLQKKRMAGNDLAPEEREKLAQLQDRIGPAPMVRPMRQPTPRPEGGIQPERRPDARAEARAQARSEERPQARAEARSEGRAEVRVETRPEGRTEIRREVQIIQRPPPAGGDRPADRPKARPEKQRDMDRPQMDRPAVAPDRPLKKKDPKPEPAPAPRKDQPNLKKQDLKPGMAPAPRKDQPKWGPETRQAVKETRDRAADLMRQIQETRMKLHAVAREPEATEERLGDLAARLGKLEAELALLRARAEAKLKQRFSPDQIDRLRQRMKDWRQGPGWEVPQRPGGAPAGRTPGILAPRWQRPMAPGMMDRPMAPHFRNQPGRPAPGMPGRSGWPFAPQWGPPGAFPRPPFSR